MSKFEVISNCALQIDGAPDGLVEGDSVIATIETDCNPGSIWSALQFGNARLVPVDKPVKAGASAPARAAAAPAAPKTTRRSAKAAGAGSPSPNSGSKSWAK